MYLSIHKDVIIKNYPFQMNKENVGDYIKNISFGSVRPFAASLTKAIANKLACMHTLKCRM